MLYDHREVRSADTHWSTLRRLQSRRPGGVVLKKIARHAGLTLLRSQVQTV